MSEFDAQLAENAAEIERALDVLLIADRLAGPGEPPGRLLAAIAARHAQWRQAPAAVPAAPDRVDAGRGARADVAGRRRGRAGALLFADPRRPAGDGRRRPPPRPPTVHKAFDEATAILAGDALLTLAFDHLAEHAAPDPAIAAALVAELAAGAGAGGMAGGQMRDIEGESDAARPARYRPHAGDEDRRADPRLRSAWAPSSGGPTATALGASHVLLPRLPGVPSSSPTICSMSPPRPTRWARRRARTPGSTSRRWSSSLGVEAARRHLGDMVHDAITALTPFGPEADLSAPPPAISRPGKTE